jgi:hypothetical protein
MKLLAKCLIVAIAAPPLQFLGVPFMSGDTYTEVNDAPVVVKELPPDVMSKNEKTEFAHLNCHKGDWCTEHDKMPSIFLARPKAGGEISAWHFDLGWEAASQGKIWIITACSDPIWQV